jgi:hypothetical protein
VSVTPPRCLCTGSLQRLHAHTYTHMPVRVQASISELAGVGKERRIELRSRHEGEGSLNSKSWIQVDFSSSQTTPSSSVTFNSCYSTTKASARSSHQLHTHTHMKSHTLTQSRQDASRNALSSSTFLKPASTCCSYKALAEAALGAVQSERATLKSDSDMVAHASRGPKAAVLFHKAAVFTC